MHTHIDGERSHASGEPRGRPGSQPADHYIIVIIIISIVIITIVIIVVSISSSSIIVIIAITTDGIQ